MLDTHLQAPACPHQRQPLVFLADPSNADIWGKKGQRTFLWKPEVQEEVLVWIVGGAEARPKELRARG